MPIYSRYGDSVAVEARRAQAAMEGAKQSAKELSQQFRDQERANLIERERQQQEMNRELSRTNAYRDAAQYAADAGVKISPFDIARARNSGANIYTQIDQQAATMRAEMQEAAIKYLQQTPIPNQDEWTLDPKTGKPVVRMMLDENTSPEEMQRMVNAVMYRELAQRYLEVGNREKAQAYLKIATDLEAAVPEQPAATAQNVQVQQPAQAKTTQAQQTQALSPLERFVRTLGFVSPQEAGANIQSQLGNLPSMSNITGTPVATGEITIPLTTGDAVVREDGTVWQSGRQVGSIDDDGNYDGLYASTGIGKALAWAFEPFKIFGASLAEGVRRRKETMADPEQYEQILEGKLADFNETYDPASSNLENIKRDWIAQWKAILPGGATANWYMSQPWYVQLLSELPAWLMLALVPSATEMRAGLLPASDVATQSANFAARNPAAARAARAALLPGEALETAIGESVNYFVAQPLRLAGEGVTAATERAVEEAFSGRMGRWLAIQGQRGENGDRVAQWFLSRNHNWLQRRVNDAIKARMARRQAAKDPTRAAEQAVEDIWSEVEPKLLAAGEAVARGETVAAEGVVQATRVTEAAAPTTETAVARAAVPASRGAGSTTIAVEDRVATATEAAKPAPKAKAKPVVQPIENKLPESSVGKETVAYDPDGKEHKLKYAVVDLDSLTVSHLETFEENPAYPQELQPRDRARAASRSQVNAIVNRFHPDQLLMDSRDLATGAPIVGRDLVVESGNGRVMALRILRSSKPAELARYSDMLKASLSSYGLDESSLEGMKNPILVRVSDVEPTQRSRFASLANQRTTMSMSPFEMALEDAGRISDEAVSHLVVAENESIDQALRKLANQPLVREMSSNMSSTERSAILGQDGTINAAGIQRLKWAVFAKTYKGDAGELLVRTFTESIDPVVQNIQNAMFASLPQVARSEALVESGQRDASLSIGTPMAKAVERYAWLKQTGGTVENYLRTYDMFAAPLEPLEVKLLSFLDNAASRYPKPVRDFLRYVAQRIESSPQVGQGSLIEMEPVTLEGIVDDAIDKTSPDTAENISRQSELFATVQGVGTQVREGLGQGAGPIRSTEKVEAPEQPPIDMATVREESVDTLIGEREVKLSKPTAAPVIERGKGQQYAITSADLSQRKGASASVRGRKLTGKAQGQMQIARELSQSLGFTLHRGHFNERGQGIYKRGRGTVRMKSGQLYTVSHEAGHYLDDVFNWRGNVAQAEIPKLLESYGRDIDPNDTELRAREAFAEFTRLYITDNAAAKEVAPKTYAAMQKVLGDFPYVNDVLDMARARVEQYVGLDPLSKVGTKVARSPDSPGIGERLGRTRDMLMRDLIDDLWDVKKAVAAGEKELGRKLTMEENAYVLARMTRGSASKANVFLEKGTFLPGKMIVDDGKGGYKPEFVTEGLWRILDAVKEPADQIMLENYLVAKRATYLNSRGIKTGIAKDLADAAVAQVEGSGRQDILNTARKVWDFNKTLLAYAYESGLISRESFQTLSQIPYYVPFHRAIEFAFSGAGKGKLADTPTVIKRMFGSEEDIVNPLESIVKNVYLTVDAAERNRVAQGLAQLSNKSMEVAKLFDPIPFPKEKHTFDAKDVVKQLVDNGVLDEAAVTGGEQGLADFLKGIDQSIEFWRTSNTKPYGEQVVSVFFEGERKLYQVADRDLYRALMGLEVEDLAMIWKILSVPAKWLRVGATWSPDFVVRNPARDQWSAYIYSTGGYFPPIDFARGLLSTVTKDANYWLYRMSGADHSMMVSLDRTALHKTLEDHMKENPAVHFVTHPLEFLQIASEFMEMATRVGEFRRVLGRTKGNTLAAGWAGRNVTLDFAQIGAKIRAYNSIAAFFNASVRGNAKVVASFYENPGPTTLKALASITIPSILLYLANRDDPRWKEIPQWQKDLSWIVMTDETIYRIPKPFELGVIFGSLPERIMEYLDTQDRTVLDEYATSLFGSMTPGVLPTAVQPLFENMANYNQFLQRPVVPASVEALPPEYQYGDYTSEVAKSLGKLINYSPAKIDNLLQSWTGGLGDYALEGAGAVMSKAGLSDKPTEPMPTAADKPVVKAFVVRNPIGSSSRSVNRFYEELDKYQAGETLLKNLMAEGNRDEFEKYRAGHPELLFQYDYDNKVFYSATARYLRNVTNVLADVRKRQDIIYNSRTMSADDKRAHIDELDAVKTKVASDALDHIKDWRQD